MRGNPFNKLISVITGISSIVSIHAYAITLKNRGIEEELKQSQAKIDKLKDELHKLELGNVNTELVESKLNSNKVNNYVANKNYSTSSTSLETERGLAVDKKKPGK